MNYFSDDGKKPVDNTPEFRARIRRELQKEGLEISVWETLAVYLAVPLVILGCLYVVLAAVIGGKQ